MADPLVEIIVARFARVLTQDLVNAVPPAAGLSTQFYHVFRALVLPGECNELPYACVLTGGQREGTSPMNFVSEQVEVEVYVFIAEADLQLVDTVRNRAVADVKKAIMRDPLVRGGQTSASAGGIDSVLVDKLDYVGVDPYPLASDQPNVEGAIVRFRFDYLHDFEDPYTGRPTS